MTREKVEILRRADTVFLEEISRANLKNQPSQCFAVLSDMKSVGVMGDFRTYDYAVILRAVVTADFVTAKASELPWEVLFSATNRIVNEVNGINRVLYDCTGKPTAAIEWC
ncbi:GMP synthase (glutamine-hydrolyzing) [Blautia sp. HCP3S3_G3]|uniref:GMP synthase (glutamine-hydrolyzing) n=1 Tax=Blautia sp. HCP3S3_G3 TaxID=3438913 RepID=UPI003F8A0C5D